MSIKATGQNSAELSNSSCSTYVDAEFKIRPLRDQIIVEPLQVHHSDFLDVIEYCKPLRGIVRAVGPGHYPKRYDHPDKGRRTKMWDSKVFQPTEVKVGDVVELGGYGEDDMGHLYRGFNFQQFSWGGKWHVICREADICAIVEADTSLSEDIDETTHSEGATA